MLEVGSKAPEFTLPDQNGTMHSLSEYRGKKVILYFYPKDMTSGCTSQACNFRDRYPQFLEKGAVVLGVSKDSVASHKKFEEKYGLPFIGKDGTPGKGLIRSTYLIDEDGVIAKAFGAVKAKDNPEQMLEEL